MKRTLTEIYEDTADYVRAWRRWRHATGYQHMTRINVERLTTLRDQRLAELGPHPTVQMLTALVLLNQCGAFTYLAQPGTIDLHEGQDPIEHRAVVGMILDDDKKDWLESQLYRRGVLSYSKSRRGPGYEYDLFVRKPLNPECPVENGLGIPVTRVLHPGENAELTPAAEAFAVAGEQMSAGDIHRLFPVRPDAAAQLYRGWQVVIYDKRFGPSTLFETLIDICEKELEIRDILAGSRAPLPGTGWDPGDSAVV